MKAHRLSFFLAIALGLLVACPDQVQAQRGRGGSGASRGGSQGGGDDERRQRMADFFSRMRAQQGQSGGGDRSSRMSDFFSRMREGGAAAGGRGGERGSSRGRGGSRSSKKKEKEPRPRLTVDLPEGFVAQDRDLDGQIGLYEWNLTALGAFRRIDANKDGFLTPRELQAAEVTEPPEGGEDASEKEEGSATASKSSSRSRGSSSSKSKKSSSSSKSAKAASTGTYDRIARLYFKRLDKDKDGKISDKEWQPGDRVRAAFEKKSIKLEIPADADKFAKAFAASRS